MRDDVRVGSNVLVQGGLNVGPAGALIASADFQNHVVGIENTSTGSSPDRP